MQTFIKGRLGAGQGFQTHRTNDIGRFQAIMHPLNGFHRKG